MMATIKNRLNPWNSYVVFIPIAEIGAGKTITVKLAWDPTGDPDPIDPALAIPAVEAPAGFEEYYVAEFPRGLLLTHFEDRIHEVVAVHVDDGEDYHSADYALIVGVRPRKPG